MRCFAHVISMLLEAIFGNSALANSEHTEKIIYGIGNALASGNMNEAKDPCATLLSLLLSYTHSIL